MFTGKYHRTKESNVYHHATLHLPYLESGRNDFCIMQAESVKKLVWVHRDFDDDRYAWVITRGTGAAHQDMEPGIDSDDPDAEHELGSSSNVPETSSSESD